MLKFILLTAFILPGACSFSQTNQSPDSLQNEFVTTLAKTKHSMDSILNPLKYINPNTKNLDEFLTLNFSEYSETDGRWVYYKERAKLQKIEQPEVSKIIPAYNFYKVNLTNYLGWHVNQGTCLLLLDSVKFKMTFAAPLWYGGISEPLVKLFIGRKFDNKESLLSFLKGLHELMEVGSGYKFINTAFADSLITYDLGYFKNDAYTTGGNGTSSTVQYNENGVWRKIRIDIKGLTIIRYTSINPITNDKEIIE